MVEEHLGQRKDATATPWIKLFSGFKVALDPKKLLLAAGGILVMSMGWMVLAWVFFDLFSSTPPQFKGGANKDEAWRTFRAARLRWNLRNEMAGSGPVRFDAGDIANTLAEYNALDAIDRAVNLASQNATVSVDVEKLSGTLTIEKKPYTFTLTKENAEKLKSVSAVPVTNIRAAGKESTSVTVGDVPVVMEGTSLAEDLQDAKTLDQLRAGAAGDPTKTWALKAFEDKLASKATKPYGRLRTLPWGEDRGPNPYLLVTGKTRPWEAGDFLRWFAHEQLPVLLEPLYKFISPIIYLLDPAAGFGNRVYLLLVIVVTLATWAIFGGAITRLAAVQVARPNEKVGLGEAFGFAWKRFQSYFSAPLFPLLFLAFFTIMLILFGLFEGLMPLIGDIFIAGLLWPIVLILGLVMAVVLAGLVGWPLMYATISAEGSDSFDALSRSYSYVYQAPWQYLWYSFLALVYGAVLVFFVGFMASLTVYLGKWGVAQAPFLSSTDPKNDREPSYLFVYAPTSFGWRDLLLSKSEFSVRTPDGGFDLSKEYRAELKWYNRIGAALVMFWLGIFFLLIVGFGYSYFWSASTIIYLLMRHKVDDTEIDEIHLEEEDEEPVMPPPSAPAAPAGGAGLTMVEAPTLRAPTTPGSSNPPEEPPPTVSESPAQPPNP